MAEEKTTNQAEAIERAKKHPAGMFVDVHRRTLQAMEMLGLAELAVDGEFYLTAKGWGEDAPEESKPVSSVEISRRVRRGPQRAAFDSALNVLLIRENLDGAEWAIRTIQEEAETLGDEHIKAFMMGIASALSDRLDKRAAELAVGNRES